jgi:ADP-dependent NAD(P)H-hydrate dehydratase / NAD(P)H-hydrate epimerase
VPAFEAAAMGAWLHGEVGRRAGLGSIADDIAAELRGVVAAGCPEPEAEDEHLPGLDAIT